MTDLENRIKNELTESSHKSFSTNFVPLLFLLIRYYHKLKTTLHESSQGNTVLIVVIYFYYNGKFSEAKKF